MTLSKCRVYFSYIEAILRGVRKWDTWWLAGRWKAINISTFSSFCQKKLQIWISENSISSKLQSVPKELQIAACFSSALNSKISFNHVAHILVSVGMKREYCSGSETWMDIRFFSSYHLPNLKCSWRVNKNLFILIEPLIQRLLPFYADERILRGKFERI